MTRRSPWLLWLPVLLAAACSSGGSGARPSASPSPAPSPSPTASPTPSRTAAPARSPTPSPTLPLGSPMTTQGAYLARRSGQTVPAGECEESWPDLLDVSCADVRLDGGVVRWVAGTRDAGGGERQWTLRLHTPAGAGQGFALRYEAVDPAGEWLGFRVGAARLTGNGVDALVVQVLHDTSTRARGYDIVTWRQGGSLTLRAHRPEAAELRVVARDGVLDDYVHDGTGFVRREITWDGVRFRSRIVGRVASSKVPPQA